MTKKKFKDYYNQATALDDGVQPLAPLEAAPAGPGVTVTAYKPQDDWAKYNAAGPVFGTPVQQGVKQIPSFEPQLVDVTGSPEVPNVGQLHVIQSPIQASSGLVMDSSGRPITAPQSGQGMYGLLDQQGAYVQPQQVQAVQGGGKGVGGK